ncbi:MAG TPA: VTT domain-containing protein [Candidatus Tectomicrobia bacterium]
MEQHVSDTSKSGQRVRIGLACAMVGTTLLVLAATPWGEQIWRLLRHPGAEQISQLLGTTTLWLPLTLVGLMVLHTLIPLPAEVLALAAGMTLGPFWGVVTIWIGAMLGACLGFFLARALGQPFLQYVVAPQRLQRWQQRLCQADVSLLLALRLLPVISFNLINYALGLSTIGWWRFLWTTGVGIVPITVVVVVFGAHLGDWRILTLITLVAVLIGVGGYLLWRHRHPIPWPRSRPPRPCGR